MSEYKYVNTRMTPMVFKDLLLKLFMNKQFDRQTAINTISEYHSQHGGIPTDADYRGIFKKAIATIREKNLASVSHVGYKDWRLVSIDDDGTQQVQNVNNNHKAEEPSVDISADETIGAGSSSVYVYYYEVYKNYALTKDMNVWQCKIGRTDVDPLSRIFGQAGTCYPEYPHVALIIRCSDSGLLEKTLHDILQLQGKWLKSAPGTEWYMTNPQEIRRLYETIMPET